MKKNLLCITFFYLSLFLLCPSTIIGQVPCKFQDDWTEKELINAEMIYVWSHLPNIPFRREFHGDGLYTEYRSVDENTKWLEVNSAKWELSENILQMNGNNRIKLKKSMVGEVYSNNEVEWKVLYFSIPNKVDIYLIGYIKCLVERKINKWQQKGEFEKVATFQERVSDNNRNQKIKEYQKEVIDSLKTYQKDYWLQAGDVKIGRYDTENETFLMHHPYGEFILPVPIDRAPKFKEEFNESWVWWKPDFILNENKFILSSLTFYNNTTGLTFVYDIGDSREHSITQIDYSFAEIELPEINSSTKTPTQIGSNNIRVGSSEVDLNIPTNTKVDNRYAIVIGNEDYQSYQRSLNAEQNVDYAVNDAKVFKEYCLKTFGVKEENLDFITNATAGAMNQKFNKVIKLMEKIGPQAELIVYYAGHGFPDEITKEPYLVPVDVSGTDLSAAIKLEDFYRDLGNTGAKVTVFLDACFTGGGRNSGLIAARGVRVKPQDEILNGNLVVLSASSGDQSALPYHQEGHGMFTYFLLEKLQNDRGYMTLGQLADYINRNVSITSLKVNEKEQDPVVNTSEKVAGSWRNWTF